MPSASDAFVDSIGVVTHLGFVDTPYAQNWDKSDKSQNVREILGDLGIRHIREGIPHPTLQVASAYVRPRLAQLYRDYGILFNILLDCRTNNRLDANQIDTYLADYANSSLELNGETIHIRDFIESIEGPNEYDMPNHKDKRDPNWVQNLKNYQSALYQKVKATPQLSKLPVVMPSLVYTKYCSNELGSFGETIDYGNLHPYPNYPYFQKPLGNFAWHLSYGQKCFGDKPIYITEIGYVSSEAGISDRTIAKYMSRLLPEFFLQPQVKRTYLYSLIDILPDRNRWGLIHPERNGQVVNGREQFTLTPKPSYHAVHSLLDLLKEGTWDKSQKRWVIPKVNLEAVDIMFDGLQSTTHHLLLQKSTGDYFLLLWQEVEAFNPDKGNFETPADQVNIYLPEKYRFQTLYQYDDSFQFDATSLTQAANKLTIQVPDRVIVLQFQPT